MNIYIWIFFGLWILSWLRDQKSFAVLIVLLLILFAGLRGNHVGTDTNMYAKLYEYICKGHTIGHFEVLYFQMNKLCAWLGLPVWGMQTLASVLTIGPLYLAIKRTNVPPILALFFYYALFGYLNSFNVVRQMIGVSFVLLGYTYYPDKIKTLICILIGAGFHTSAIVGLMVFILPYVKIKPINVIAMLIGTFMIGLVVNDNILSYFIGKYIAYFTDPVLSKSFGFRENTLYSAIMALVLNIMFAMIYISSNAEIKESKWFKLYLIMIVLNNLTFRLVLGARIIMYFTMVQIIFYPLLYKANVEDNPMIVKIVTVLYASLIFFKIIFIGGHAFLPYTLAV